MSREMLKFHYIRLIWLLGALLLAVAAPGALALAEPSDADERSFSRAATEMSFGGLQDRPDSSVWLRGWFHNGEYDTRSELPDTTMRAGGVLLGADKRLGASVVAGISIGRSWLDVRGRSATDGSDIDADSLDLGLHGVFHLRGLTLAAGFGFSRVTSDVTAAASGRIFDVDGVKSDVLTGNLLIYGRGRRRGSLSLGPFAGVNWRRVGRQSFAAGGLDFSLDTLERWSFPLGLRFEWRPAPSRGWTLIPSLNVGYQRATGDRRMRIRQFYGGRQLRVIETTPLDRDFFRLGVGLEARRKNFHAGLGLTSLIGRHQRSISGTFAARWEF